MIDIEELLGEIELTLKTGKKSLFSPAVTINPEDIYRTVDKIRDNLPDMIREATYIVKNRERQEQEISRRAQMMVATAEKRANDVLREAYAKAEHMVSVHEVIRRAEHESASVKNEAQDFCAAIKRDARAKAIAVLDEAARTLVKQVNDLTALIKDLQSMDGGNQ